MEKPELLAPAGSRESLYAAVSAGADAVYLGAGSFNARRGAENFTLDNLSEACDYAHLRDVPVYLTLNTIVLPDEVTSAMELVRQAYRAGVDAFIMQDIGIIAETKRSLPQARIHASTQINIHSEAGVKAAAQLGVARVTLARELSLNEIGHLCRVAAEVGVEIETFVHGALCVCYSGQCFMSSMIGGRSANRGLCAQACRLPYTLHNRALRKTLPAEGEHLLSPKDLCAIELIPHLAQAGVASFKVEGRMKSPEYVASVVSVYRRALDSLPAASIPTAASPPTVAQEHDRNEVARYKLPQSDGRQLDEAFSRGFTTAYLENQRGNEIMSYAKPNNRGSFIGRVSTVSGNVASFVPESAINEGDVLEFWTNKGRFASTVESGEVDRRGEVHVTATLPVGKGDRIFRVRNAALRFVPDPLEPRIPISGMLQVRIGQPLRVSFSVDGRHEAGDQPLLRAEAIGAIVEKARTKAITADEVYTHIDRLGSVPFMLTALDIELDEGVGIGYSELHRVRARALDELKDTMLAPYKSRTLSRISSRRSRPHAAQKGCDVVVIATNPACARSAKQEGADTIFVPALNYKRGEASIAGQVSETAEQAGYPKQVSIALPIIEHDAVLDTREQQHAIDVWQCVKPDKTVLVESVGQLLRARSLGAKPELAPHANITNLLALETAQDFGACRVWLSPELSLSQIEEIATHAPVSVGVFIMGAQELMVTEHCLLMSQGTCDQGCSHCPRRKSPHFLKDRLGYEFPVITDRLGRSHLYNAVELDVAHAVPDLVRMGVNALMVDTTLMNVAEAKAAVRRAVRARDIAVKNGDGVSKKEGTTSGHLYRGVK